MENIKIVNLADEPQFLEEAALFMWKEFAEQFGTKYEDVIYRTKHCINKDTVPQTYIAKVEDKLIGVVSIWNNDLAFRQDLSPWLAALYVKDEYRHNRVGSLLQDRCIEETKKMGYKYLYLITELDNYYERKGWEFVEEAPVRGGFKTKLYRYLLNDK